MLHISVRWTNRFNMPFSSRATLLMKWLVHQLSPVTLLVLDGLNIESYQPIYIYYHCVWIYFRGPTCGVQTIVGQAMQRLFM